MKHGIYVHVPFCEQKCHYCAFTVAVSGTDAHEPYIRRVVREIELSGFSASPGSIFFGGGTPSIVDAAHLGTILRALPSGAVEISIEVNPGTIDQSKLQQYRDIGINRISLGAQSFHDEDLRNAGRLHGAEDVTRDFKLLRGEGFNNVNIDLIAGLPGQQMALWKKNLEAIGRLQPEHVSIYMLDQEDRSAWGKRADAFEDDDLFATFYQEAAEQLSRLGYVHYEISNWAKPGFECRHNLKYWTGVPYRGFGVSAHSFSRDVRSWNTSSLSEYAELVDSGKLPIGGQEELTPEMRVEEAFMLGLRQMRGFDIWESALTLGLTFPKAWFERVCELEDSGLVQFDGKVLKLTPAGWLLANGITEELLWPTLLSTSEATP